MAKGRFHVGVDAASWYNDRGYGRFTRELLKALIERDSEFRYTLVFDQAPSLKLPDGCQIVVAGTRESIHEATSGDASRSLGDLWRAGRVVRDAGFDLFFFPTVYSYFPIIRRIPYVVCIHDTTPERFPKLVFPTWKNRVLWKIKSFLARLHATRVMTISGASAKDLSDTLGIPQYKIDVVTEAPEPVFRIINDATILSAAKARYGIPDYSRLLVHIGGMNAHKNILRLLEAMPSVIGNFPDTHLAIVGSLSRKGFWDNVSTLQAYVRDTPPLSAHVHFTDYVSDADLVELLNAAKAMVFPSLWEGFGLPAVEAMSCGVPVLASNRSSLPEVVGDAGLFFDPEDTDDIAGTIMKFLGDKTLQSKLCARAKERAKRFTWAKAAELAEDCFRRTINR
jgi:glycosyltransferase involved in cell wall biosynthesis